MKILLTGVTGYIGMRLLPVLLEKGHHVVCCVRDGKRFEFAYEFPHRLQVIEVNFLDTSSLGRIPDDIDVAYYLIHSMAASTHRFKDLEMECAQNFKAYVENTRAKQVIYLSGIVNEQKLSPHLESRKGVENMLKSKHYHLTVLRAGIIVGSGSASFEIIRDLVEKLPIMVAPKWLNTRSQPIAIRNVIQYLEGVLLLEKAYDQRFDIGGPEVLTYKQMLMTFARIRQLKRLIFTLPVLTPKLSSYWLYFVTSTTYKLAVNLVDSMRVEVVCKNNPLTACLHLHLLTYEEAVRLAFDKIEQQEVLSSWTDALSQSSMEAKWGRLMKVPSFGCLKDMRSYPVHNQERTLQKIWSIGGGNGWYYAQWLWELRGLLDKILGGVGLRRGRKNQATLKPGDTLDFWRVIHASKAEKRLLLYAEMKLPGEAWLEFYLREDKLYQIATFRPKGVWGRIYWYVLLPVHHFMFKGMVKRMALEE
ncbi:SDR family oxidoreductase [Rapidithrix thailandica]|uniref:SDR family oxidoreductase n=1 Tax=Rapidithrix thailandica TaxID=413964 RepID=A0AAW9SDQ9_9BACT